LIIGGGPAGLFAALSASHGALASQRNVTITILERNDQPGRKLLLTGSGQCNLTRDEPPQAFLDHYGGHGDFLGQALHAYPPSKVMEQFTAWKLPLMVREDRKVFPRSLKASDVSHTLRRQCEEQGITLACGCRVVSLEKKDGTFTARLEDGTTVPAQAVIIATGGLSFPTTGCTGDGYRLARSFGHTVIPPRAALSAVLTPDSTIGRCSGLSFPLVSVEVVKGEACGKHYAGALLVTHTGLSGPVVIDHSRDFASGDILSVCFLPHGDGKTRSVREMESLLMDLAAQGGAQQLRTILHQTLLPKSFIDWILEETGIDGTRKAAEIGKKQLTPIVQAIVSHRFTISLTGCLPTAMATAGGVSLTEVASQTMESHLVQGLYFAGEVLDIDGDTGGYNLQAAWSTAYVAGQSAVQGLLSR